MGIIIRRFVFVALLISSVSTTDIFYNRRAKNANVQVQWFYELGAEFVLFKIHFPLKTGWVGIGFNDKSSMIGADCVVGWIDQNGEKHLEDRHAIKNEEPILDKHEDYILLTATIDKNGTTLEFKRKIKNCDKEDYKFLQGHTYLLFAYSDEYPKLENEEYKLPFHRTNHYASKEIIANMAAALDERLDQPEDTTDTYDIEFTNFTIPQQKTMYWCQVFEIPNNFSNDALYFTGYKPMITPGKEKFFHHGAVGQCRGNSLLWAERVKQGGFDCTNAEKFYEFIQCYPAIVTYVIGSPGDYYPYDIAFPFGEKVGGTKYLYFQAHFTNEDLEKGVLASSKIRMFLTTHKRKNIAGILGAISQIDYTLAIPPKQPNFGYSITCPSQCLNLLPEDDVTIFAVVAHMHLRGRKIYVRHFDKNGIELKPIYEDDNYIFDSQDSYFLPQRIKLKKGESLSTDCYYDSTDSTETVLGGLATSDEMCVSLLFIYPIQPNFSACSFGLSKNEEAEFFGVSKFDLNSDKITEPSSLQGKTLQNVITNYKWNDEKVKEFQKMALEGNKAGVCIGVGGAILGEDHGKLNITKKYQKPKDECDC